MDFSGGNFAMTKIAANFTPKIENSRHFLAIFNFIKNMSKFTHFFEPIFSQK